LKILASEDRLGQDANARVLHVAAQIRASIYVNIYVNMYKYICTHTHTHTHTPTHTHSHTHRCMYAYTYRGCVRRRARRAHGRIKDVRCRIRRERRTSLHMLTPARTRKGDSALSRDNPCVRTRARIRKVDVGLHIYIYIWIWMHTKAHTAMCMAVDTCVSIDMRESVPYASIRSIDRSVWAFVHIRTYIHCVHMIHL
jgi:hypothetical protein